MIPGKRRIGTRIILIDVKIKRMTENQSSSLKFSGFENILEQKKYEIVNKKRFSMVAAVTMGKKNRIF